ncbi:hypothetical protein EUGRSUZ_C02320 [Eucalyptus grandis]|uniref:Uncharacterized protein n=2 Tax=Eucalyptus grandis TaxID=71139 RepID=A0ACC3LF65_EUCGR|nr:hypothetical protein EUGRSUZ_C02320 [Eucalyptus grandis]
MESTCRAWGREMREALLPDDLNDLSGDLLTTFRNSKVAGISLFCPPEPKVTRFVYLVFLCQKFPIALGP